jgi:hypothetical protein
MMRAMAMSAAERKEPFTDRQKYVLRQLGLTDWDMPTGYIGRAQALYQPQVQKQGDLPQGAYDKLSKLGDMHASKEVSRARQSQEV